MRQLIFAAVALVTLTTLRAAEPANQSLAAILEEIQIKDRPHNIALTHFAKLIPADPQADLTPFLPAVPSLLESLGWGGPGRSESELAERILIRLGKSALPAVMKTLQKGERGTQRVCCIRILAAVDRQQALKLLPELLSDAYLRRQAIQSLTAFGKEAAPAADKIKQYLADSDLIVQIYARIALVRITGQTSPYGEELAGMVMNPKLDPTRQYGDVHFIAAEQLWQLGDQAKAAYPLFIKAFSDPDKNIRHLAVGAFNIKGPTSPDIIAGLIHVLEHEEDAEIRASACGAIATIGAPAKAAAPALAKILAEDDAQSGWLCVMALATFGVDVAFAPLLKAAHSKHKQTRIDVACYITKFATGHAKEVRDCLTSLADDPDPDVQKAARQELALLAPTR